MDENEISRHVVDCAFHIHRALGPGLLESVYETVLAHDLSRRGLTVQRQVPITIQYDGMTLDDAYRADLLVGGKVIIEIESLEHLMPVHRKQTLTYVKLAGMRLGISINFGSAVIKDGVVRLVNRLPDS